MSQRVHEAAGKGGIEEPLEGQTEQPREGEARDRPRKVAVIGVHGIARHPPGETINAMADLLLALPADRKQGNRAYGPFKGVEIQIPLQRVCGPVDSPEKKRVSFKEASVEFATTLHLENKQDGKAAARRTPLFDPGNEYTRQVLEGYQGGADSNVYVTTRLEGESIRDQRTKVDIYEILWADLTHPESNVIGFFLSLFTLLLHLASLSRLALDAGSGEMANNRLHWLWRIYVETHRWAVRFLQILAPLFKVLLLVVILCAVPAVSQRFPGEQGRLAFAVGLGLLGGTAVGFRVLRAFQWRGTSPWIWALGALFPGFIGGAFEFLLAYLINAKLGPPSSGVAGSLGSWIFLGAPIIFFILSKYESYRKGIQVTGWVAYGLSFAAYVTLLVRHGGDVSRATFLVAEVMVAGIRATWLGMSLMAFLSVVLGSLVWRLSAPGRSEQQARLRASVRTSRFAFAMPAVFFLLVTPLIWAALFEVANWLQKPFFQLGEKETVGLGSLGKFLVQWQLIPALETEVRSDYLESILSWGLGYQLPVTLVLVGMAIFLLIWWALPSVLTEGFTLRDKRGAPRSSSNADSVKLGSWLSRGLDATSVITLLFWCSIFAAFPAVYLLGFLSQDWARWCLGLLTRTTLILVGNWLVLVSGATLVALVKYGSSVLETILDVDTYLRDEPADATPRAKIFERYVSMLRYVGSLRREDGSYLYDSVVIVAHSLGSLISADILRYLDVAQRDAQRHDPALKMFDFGRGRGSGQIELKLLTMGSPIRQLLNRFFPYLYDWARPEPDNGLGPLPEPATKPDAYPISSYPDPAEFGLAQWVNTYRSGDYVGRSLWLQEWYMRNLSGEAAGQFPERIEMLGQLTGPGRTSRVEMCIGAGAHTRYWDDTAPDVSETLHAMISG